MPPSRKRARASASTSAADASAADASGSPIVLSGGAAEKPRTVDKYRSGAHTDVELQSGDGRAFRAHALCLMAGSEYMEALFARGWSDARGPIKLGELAPGALAACLDFIYTGRCAL